MTDLLAALPTTRIALSLPADDMAMLTWWAEEWHGVPLTDVLREAIGIYLLSVRPVYRLARKSEHRGCPVRTEGTQ